MEEQIYTVSRGHFMCMLYHSCNHPLLNKGGRNSAKTLPFSSVSLEHLQPVSFPIGFVWHFSSLGTWVWDGCGRHRRWKCTHMLLVVRKKKTWSLKTLEKWTAVLSNAENIAYWARENFELFQSKWSSLTSVCNQLKLCAAVSAAILGLDGCFPTTQY